ncbi:MULTISPECIES: hypothetical protein [Streptomyces]|uniref:hypothetical protein n=1 Tax=Streptomyces TaxID=1883 RepID=UPI001CEF700A|nr:MULTISPECIES: hypothetical protein [Streptomyces]
MEQVQAVQHVCTYSLAALAVANGHILRSGAAAPAPPGVAAQVETPPMESRTAALGWLENEQANVLACIRRANNLALHELVIRMAAAMAPFLRQAGPWPSTSRWDSRSSMGRSSTGWTPIRAEGGVRL